MRHYFLTFLTFFMLQGGVSAQTFKSPDIMINSRLDYDWSEILVLRIRTLLKNFNIQDPFLGQFPGTMVVNESEIGPLLPEDALNLYKNFGEAVGLNILNARTLVSLEDLTYEVKGFKTNLKASESTRDGLIIGSDVSASEVSVEAGKISLGLVIPGKNNSPVFNVEIINPRLKAYGENLINFYTKLKFLDQRTYIQPQILSASFDKMANNLLVDIDSIELDYDRLIIPTVSLRIGSKTINFSAEKIEKLIRSKHEAIKGILLAQMTSKLNSDTDKALRLVTDKVKIQKDHWIQTSEVTGQLNIGTLSTTQGMNNIEVNMPADFCTTSQYLKYKVGCLNNKLTQTAPSRLNPNMHEESIRVMKDLMERGDATLVASVSEDYINKLLVATIDAGLWKKGLDEAGVTLGPNKVIMRLDRTGDTGTVIMDVVYNPSKMEKLLTGAKVIRIPLVLEMGLRIDIRDGIPFVVIHLQDVDTSDETIINGRPQDNIISTVKDITRFKKKVAKAIREKVSILRNKDMLELPYPQYKDVGLEKAEFISDGKGRMNAYLSIQDFQN